MALLTKRLLFRIGALLVIGLIAAAILAFPLYQLARSWAENQLLQEYESATAEEEYELAFQKAYRAHQLFPASEEAKLALARSTLNHPHQSANRFWDQALDLPRRSPQDLKDYVNHLVDSFQFQRAFRFTEQLYRELPGDEDVQRLYIQGLIRGRDYAEVTRFIEQRLKEGQSSPFLFENLYAALWGMNTEDSRRAALGILFENAEKPDAIGASAARRLISLGLLSPEKEAAFAHRLLENPEASTTDFLSAVSKLVQLEKLDLSQLTPLFEQRIDTSNPDELLLLADWYVRNDLPEQALELAPPDAFRADPRTARVYHQALIENGRAEEAYDNTLRTDIDPGLDPVDILLVRAQAQIRLGRTDEFKESLNLAVEQASLSHFTALEQALFDIEAWQVADQLYQRVLEIDGLESIGYQKMIWSKYLQADEYSLLRYLREVRLAEYREEPPVLAFLAYLKLLFRQDAIQTRFYIEELVSEYPNVADFRLIQAFSFFQDEEFGLAWDLSRDQTEPILRNGTRFQRIVLLLTALQSGYSGDLKPLEEYLSTIPLLASEQRLINAAKRNAQAKTAGK